MARGIKDKTLEIAQPDANAPDAYTVFWVVTRPSKTSGIVDICFESDMEMMHRQFLGGLTWEEIESIFVGPNARGDAMDLAHDLLDAPKED